MSVGWGVKLSSRGGVLGFRVMAIRSIWTATYFSTHTTHPRQQRLRLLKTLPSNCGGSLTLEQITEVGGRSTGAGSLAYVEFQAEADLQESWDRVFPSRIESSFSRSRRMGTFHVEEMKDQLCGY